MSFPFPRPFPGPSIISQALTGAISLLDVEWNGFAVDFTNNTYAVRVSTGAEAALGGSPFDQAAGASMDFTDNSYVVSA